MILSGKPLFTDRTGVDSCCIRSPASSYGALPRLDLWSNHVIVDGSEISWILRHSFVTLLLSATVYNVVAAMSHQHR